MISAISSQPTDCAGSCAKCMYVQGANMRRYHNNVQNSSTRFVSFIFMFIWVPFLDTQVGHLAEVLSALHHITFEFLSTCVLCIFEHN